MKQEQNRDSDGKYTIKSKIANFFARLWFLTKIGVTSFAVLALAVFSGYALRGNEVSAQVNYVAAPVTMATSSPISIEDKVNMLKNAVLNEMANCENPHHYLVWQDDNKAGTLPMKDKVSNGDLAYKISTVQREYSTLNGKKLSDKEALELALDPQQARALAIDAWVNIKGSVNEWSCATDQEKTQIEDIRLITK